MPPRQTTSRKPHPGAPRPDYAEVVTREADFLAALLLPFLEGCVERVGEARAENRPVDDERLRADFERVLARSRADNGALHQVGVALDLDVVDLMILTLAVGPYLEPRLARRYRELQESALDDRCSVALALELLGGDGKRRLLLFERFQPERRVFRDGLLSLELPTGARGDALVERVVCVPQRTIDRLLGWPRLDEAIRQYCALDRMAVPLENVILPDWRRREVLSLVRHHDRYREFVRRMGFSRVIPYGRGVTLLFAGPPGTGKTLFARALAHTLERPLLRVYADRLAESQEPIEPIVLGLFRDAALNGAVVFFDECEGLFSRRSAKLAFLLTELERFEGIVILATNAPHLLDDAMDRRIVYRLDFEVPGPDDRLQIWELHLPAEAPIADDVDLPLLASLFAFPGGAIKNAVLIAVNRALDYDPDDPVIDMATLRIAAESQLKHNLEDLAHKTRAPLTLADIVLPPSERAKVEEIVAACRNKDYVQNKWGFGRRLVTGRGICVLFDGPPGTGKTLCAEILAAALDRTLYRINVANVMSKWIGETEKNIAEVFSRAKATMAMLLFDEADSLFAKRTEIQSSNDRFANQEVNLLLQEVERFDGVVILTTNFFGGLDDALKRRIQYRVTFPRPTAGERLKIWRTLIPGEAPLAKDVDLEQLANTFEFAGGNIKNALLRAAYRACEDRGPLTMHHLVAACRRESEAAGMLFREAASANTETPEPTVEQLERMARARAEWEMEARRLFGSEAMGGPPLEREPGA